LQTSLVCPVFESITVVTSRQLQVTVLAFSCLTTTQCSMSSAVGGGIWLRIGSGVGATGCFFAAQPTRSRQNTSQAFLIPFVLARSCPLVDGNLGYTPARTVGKPLPRFVECQKFRLGKEVATPAKTALLRLSLRLHSGGVGTCGFEVLGDADTLDSARCRLTFVFCLLSSLFERRHVDYETIARVAFLCALISFVNFLDRDHYDIGGDACLPQKSSISCVLTGVLQFRYGYGVLGNASEAWPNT